jgi:replicative DNA helicase
VNAVVSFPGRRPEEGFESARMPPFSILAEQNVLGSLLLQPEAIVEVVDILQPEDFYTRQHQVIYAALCDMHQAQKPIDVFLVAEWLKARGESEQAGGDEMLIELHSAQPTAANARAYAKIVADKSALRRLIDTGTRIANSGFEAGTREAEEVVAEAAAQIAQLTQASVRDGGLRYVRTALGEAWEELVNRDAGTIDCGLTPPYSNLANILPGLEETDFCVIAGRPGMGKTVAGLEWAEYAAEQKGKQVAFFSLEMSRKQLVARLMSKRSGVSLARMRQKGGLDDADWSALTQAQIGIRNLSLAIDDTSTATIDAVRARAARMHAKVQGGLGLIVIDYLQLMGGQGRETTRAEEVAYISRGCKLMAKTLRCPVVALSQLNRGLEARPDKRPVMSDLRESGAIEQDADVIVFLYRDDYYSKDDCGAPGIAEAIVAKQRQGPPGTAYLNHHLDRSFFTDYHGPRPVYSKRKAKEKDDGEGLGDLLAPKPTRGSRKPKFGSDDA